MNSTAHAAGSGDDPSIRAGAAAGSPVDPEVAPARTVDAHQLVCFLSGALVFHFTYFKQTLLSKESEYSHVRAKFAACGALVLWFGVGAAGRSIGFFG